MNKQPQPRAFPSHKGVKVSDDVGIRWPCGCLQAVKKGAAIPAQCSRHRDPILPAGAIMKDMTRFASVLLDDYGRIWVSSHGSFVLSATPWSDSDLSGVLDVIEKLIDGQTS